MDVEFFVPPGEAQRWHEYWLAERMRWYTELGIRADHLQLRPHDKDELSHYSSATSDVEYLFPMGYSELEGIANRGRATLAFLVDAYDTEEVEERRRTVLRLHPRLAPVKVAVLPLVSKDGLPEKAREVYDAVRKRLTAEFDEGGSIGKRYRRQDEIGTPWGVTVDHQTLEDATVTLRDRDSLEQTRVAVEGLAEELTGRVEEEWKSPKLG